MKRRGLPCAIDFGAGRSRSSRLTDVRVMISRSQRTMPTYEYACKSCGHRFEEIQRISEPALDTCPKCGERTAQRLISQGNFILKGGGWYTTGGYGSPAKSSLSETSTSSSSSSSSSTKSDSAKSESASSTAETKSETSSAPADKPKAATTTTAASST